MSPYRISPLPQDLMQALNRYLERLCRHPEAPNRLDEYPVPDGRTETDMPSTVEAVTDAITSRLEQAHPEVTVEVVSGRRPLYPYLFGVE